MTSKVPVVLVSMPWATVARPSLSLATLAAVLRTAGFTCDVLYANLLFSTLVGSNSYELVAQTPDYFGVAEHVFATQIFGTEQLNSTDYLHRVAASVCLDPASPVCSENLLRLRDLVPEFLELVAAELLGRRPRVVGFTCTFNQVMASAALARVLKRIDPSIQTVLGGPCVHGDMGVSYSRIFQEYVDCIFLGEADELLPQYLDRVSHGAPYDDVPGIAIAGRRTREPALLRDLDRLPIPDFTDYFSTRTLLEESGFSLTPVHSLPFEASRGCWWGQKHHCTFCGLNSAGMTYRSKSPARVVCEIHTLAETYGCPDLMAADNILDFRAYRELLPLLADRRTPANLFFEIKANVSRDDVAALRAAGVVWVQPGFESFSDHVLKLMKKGTTALQNVAALKWLAEFGIRISYNLLVGFPGETAKDFDELLRIIDKVTHLPSPGPEAHIVQVQRFAPFHFAAERLGIGPIRASGFYRHLIPPDLAEPSEYAYFFERDFPSDAPVTQYLPVLNEALQTWYNSHRKIRLRVLSDHLDLVTTTELGESISSLSSLESAILVLADSPVSFRTLMAALARILTQEDLLAAMAALQKRGLILEHGTEYLALPSFEKPARSTDLEGWLERWHSSHLSPSPAAPTDGNRTLPDANETSASGA